MQLFGRGLRRRLPPMLDGDPRRIRMVYSLLFALPGTPVLFYEEEIGMGENLAVEGRFALRTPMQWMAEKNGGFSRARPSRLPAPVTEGPFGPEHVNVAQQRKDTGSLLAFVAKLARRYRESPEVGMGDFEVLEHNAPGVLVHRCTWAQEGDSGTSTLLVHNLSPEATEVSFTLPSMEEDATAEELFSTDHLRVGAGGSVTLTVDGYGHQWWRLLGPDDKRLP